MKNRIVFKRLEIKNFEIHEHSVFEFVDGFNLICGDGDAGKSSVRRAIELVAFNSWTPDSLRIGCKNCEVSLTTNKGTVKVVRGTKNEWTVITPEGKQEFDKIGKNVILPEASKVIGMYPVTIGDDKININIMSQLEKHFMMAEVGGKKISGSSRAQIIDEISGLSGMESIIKTISLDNTRNSKEIARQNNNIEEWQEKKHSVDELEQEEDLLNQVSKIVSLIQDGQEKIKQIGSLVDEFDRVRGAVDRVKKELKSIPHIKKLTAMVTGVEKSLFEIEDMQVIVSDYDTTSNIYNRIKTELSGMPSVTSVQKLVDKVEKICNKTDDIKGIIDIYDDAQQKYESCNEQFNGCVKSLEDVQEKELELLKSFDICPITRKPIVEKCTLYEEANS